MKKSSRIHTALAGAMLCLAISVPASAGPIVNGGFESGLTGWTTVDQAGGDGTFNVQSGTTSPLNGFPVPAPPQGSFAAMTDSFGPGSHVLYQDFLVPSFSGQATLQFSINVNNNYGAPGFYIRPDLDFAATSQTGSATLNQQARVDLMTTAQDPLSVAGGDVLLNLFQTNPGDPLESGYTPYQVDVTQILQAYAGQTLRIRFAEVDNVAPFNFGVDDVDMVISNPVPEPSSLILVLAGLAFAGLSRRMRG
jgi:hypothetical protein